MSERPVGLLIEDIWEAIERIERYVHGITHAAFLGDEKTTDAVVRNLEIIGEAANRLPHEFKGKHRTVTWAKIVGLRHRIVHEYFGVDLDIIWQILQHDLPVFKEALQSIRNQLSP